MPTEGDTHRIVFTPSGRRGDVPDGSSILDAARGLGVDLDSVCGGRGLCGRCQVVPVFGRFPKHGVTSKPAALGALTVDEQRYDSRRGLAEDRRLGCKVSISGDLVVDVPPDSQLHRQVVRKRLEVRDLTIDPVLRLFYVEVPAAELERPMSDVERTLDALAAEWELDRIDVVPEAIQDVRAACIAGGDMTVAIRDGSSLVTAWSGLHDTVYGIAFDVGSTTIAGHLCDLHTGESLASAGTMNPQVRFGEDLMSRVSYVMLNDGGAEELTSAVRAALADLVDELCTDAGVPPDDVLEITLVGNPIMHHLVFGLDVRPLGESPFALATAAPIDVAARGLGLDVHRAARVHALGCIAGHVGADAAAAILSEAPHRSRSIQLLVDVGTNAEIVLGNDTRLLAASSPTGPAFEGAQISSGQRATTGAIERVRIDRTTLEPRYRVIGAERWSDEEGFAVETDHPEGTGICGSGIIEAVAELFLAGVIGADGRFSPDAAEGSSRVVAEGRTYSYRVTQTVSVTQNDVRAIQLAKAALAAGVKLLMDHFDTVSVDRIRLAGAFGSHIDPTYAMVLGLIPDCDLESVSAAGNAGGTGAVIALLDAGARDEITGVTRTIEKIETATEPRFQEHFVDAMAFPHASDPYPNLRSRIDLPDATGARPSRPSRRRKRRVS